MKSLKPLIIRYFIRLQKFKILLGPKFYSNVNKFLKLFNFIKLNKQLNCRSNIKL